VSPPPGGVAYPASGRGGQHGVLGRGGGPGAGRGGQQGGPGRGGGVAPVRAHHVELGDGGSVQQEGGQPGHEQWLESPAPAFDYYYAYGTTAPFPTMEEVEEAAPGDE
jgi:hypothetical protein